MSAISDYLENAFLDHLTGNAALTTPANLYVALFSTATADDGSGTELTGNGYARQTASFGAAAAGQTSNTGAVTFTASGGNWVEATHAAIMDANAAGNMLFHGALSQAEQINDGGSITFNAGSLVMALD